MPRTWTTVLAFKVSSRIAGLLRLSGRLLLVGWSRSGVVRSEFRSRWRAVAMIAGRGVVGR